MKIYRCVKWFDLASILRLWDLVRHFLGPANSALPLQILQRGLVPAPPLSAVIYAHALLAATRVSFKPRRRDAVAEMGLEHDGE